MSGVNKAIIIGRLGKDPEIKVLDSGVTIANLSVATSKKIKGEETTEWHRMTAFNKTAEIIGEYLKKGSQAYFDGEIQTRSYDKDGEKRYSTEIIVNNVQFLSGKADATMPADDDATPF